VLLAALVIALAAGIGVVVNDAIKSGAAGQPAALGDSCLVGTWRDGAGSSSTTWDGHYVALRGGGGDIDHISANGTDEDTWGARAKPLYGIYQGHTLKEILHGQNILAIHVTRPGHLSVTESGWSAGSTDKFIYEGRAYPASLDRRGGKNYYAYECTRHKFKWRVKNRTVDREARISGTP